MVNSEWLTGTIEYLMQNARCRINRCRYTQVRLRLLHTYIMTLEKVKAVVCVARHTAPVWRMLVKYNINNLWFFNICSFNTFERIYAITKVQSNRPFKRKKRGNLLSHAVLQQACPCVVKRSNKWRGWITTDRNKNLSLTVNVTE